VLTSYSNARRAYEQVTTAMDSAPPLPGDLLKRLRNIPTEAGPVSHPLPAALRALLENIAHVRPRLPHALRSPAMSFALTLALMTGVAALSDRDPSRLLEQPFQIAGSQATLRFDESTLALSSWITDLNRQLDRTRGGVLGLRDRLNSGIATLGKLSLSTAETSR
jgi:hypothetical protein